MNYILFFVVKACYPRPGVLSSGLWLRDWYWKSCKENWEKKFMHSEWPRKNILRYGKKYSYKGNVNEKKWWSSNIPHPPPLPFQWFVPNTTPLKTTTWVWLNKRDHQPHLSTFDITLRVSVLLSTRAVRAKLICKPWQPYLLFSFASWPWEYRPSVSRFFNVSNQNWEECSPLISLKFDCWAD